MERTKDEGDSEEVTKEWASDFNRYSSWKVAVWAEHIRGIIDENLLPPVTVNWDLVLGCNYRCPHCIWAKRRSLPPTKVPTEFIKKVPKFLHDWGVKGCCLAGESGDPSLHPDLSDCLRLLHYWNIQVGYISNGYVLDIPPVAHYTQYAGFSIDAGTPDAYAKVKGVPASNFHEVTHNIAKLTIYATNNKLPLELAYKFLILPNSYQTIYEGAKIAREIGIRDFQVRPADLPLEEIQKIDIKKLEEQLEKVHELETDSFHVFTVRHKFDGLKKKPVKHCWATPLTSTWTATGDVVLCVDHRDDPSNILCNYLKEGLPVLKEMWGKQGHHDLIRQLNLGIPNCKRCTNGGYNEIIEKAFASDPMDMRMI